MNEFFRLLSGNLETSLLEAIGSGREAIGTLVELLVSVNFHSGLNPVLKELVNSDDSLIAAGAIDVLTIIGDHQAMSLLANRLVTGDKQLYVRTRRALEDRFSEGRSLHMQPFLDLLTQNPERAGADGIIGAISLFVAMQSDLANSALVAIIMNEQFSISVREAALRALTQIPAESSVSVVDLRQLLESNCHSCLQAGIIKLLTRIDKDLLSLEFLTSYYQHSDTLCDTKLSIIDAIAALHSSNNDSFLSLVQIYQTEPDVDIRNRIVAVLAGLPDDPRILAVIAMAKVAKARKSS